tara:strand:- start:759 stop:1718 length:960 start_codon:yes stop_codon:yes gene_type:complete
MKSIGFGTWAWGNQTLWGYSPKQDDQELEAAFNTAIKYGINLIDTADSYGIAKLNGRSEKLLGNYLKKLSPLQASKITVATKLAPYPWRIGRKGFVNAFKASKERLGNKVDRLQLHWSTSRYAPWQEVSLIDGLGDLLEEGLISEIGLSNMGANRLRWINSRLRERNIPIKSLQVQFSLLAPNPERQFKLLKLCKELNIDLLAYSPLALGVLAQDPEDINLRGTFLRKRIFQRLLPSSTNLRKKLKEISLKRNVSQAQVALNWCRFNGAIPIPGIRSSSQAKDVASSMKWELSGEDVNELNSLSLSCLVRMPNNPFQSN